MASFTFKNFLSFVENEEELSDEQICEIFGIFRNNDKVEKLRQQKRELAQKKTDALRRANAAKQGKTLAQQHDPTQRDPSVTHRAGSAASGRAAERDWIAHLANEETEGEKAQRHAREGAKFGSEVKRGEVKPLERDERKKYTPAFLKAYDQACC